MHWCTVKQAHVFEILKKYLPEEIKNLSKDREFPFIPPINVLTIQKSERRPLPTQEIDEGSIDGNMAYLDKVFKDILKLPDQFFEGRYILHFGDLSTIRMQNSIKNMRHAEESAYDRYEFVTPVFQLFHTRMAHLRQVFNVHWGSESKDDPGTLHEIKTILRRKRINENASEVYECERLLEIAVESSILGMALAAQHVESIEALRGKLVNWDILESLVLSITDKIDDQQIYLS